MGGRVAVEQLYATRRVAGERLYAISSRPLPAFLWLNHWLTGTLPVIKTFKITEKNN
jgi:hypothetical protein